MGIKIMKKIIFFTLLMFNIVFSEYKTVILSTSPLVVKTYTDYADIKEIITSRIFLPKYNFISISNIIGSTYDDSRSIAIGKGLNIPLIGIEDNILLGFNSTSTFKSICIGNNAYSEYEAISIGHNARAIYGGLAIGNTFASYGIAINFSTTRSTGASRGISIGGGNFAQADGISIGGNNRSEGNSISIGGGNNTENSSIALGNNNFATRGSRVLGSGSRAEGFNSFVIGDVSRVTAENSGVIGNFTVNNITNTIKIQDSVRLDVSSINVITLRVSTTANIENIVNKMIETTTIKFSNTDIKITTETIASFIQIGAVIIAASDTPKELKSFANYVCDGVADEEEIQEAIYSGKSVVYLLPGTFYISSYSAVLCNNISSITIQGSGMYNTILVKKSGPGENRPEDYRSYIFFSSYSARNITFRDFQLDGWWREGNRNMFGLIYARSVNGLFFFKNIYFTNGFFGIRGSFQFLDNAEWYITDCIFDELASHCIAPYQRKVIISGCLFKKQNFSKSGIIEEPGSGSVISNNSVVGYQGNLFVHLTRNNILVTNNVLKDCYFWASAIQISGYWTNDCWGNVVSGNILHNISGYDSWTPVINLDRTRYNLISNNIIKSTTSVAIQTRAVWYWEINDSAQFVQNNFITGNYIYDTSHGIQIRNGQNNDNNYVANNYCWNVSVPFSDERGTNISRYNSWDTNLVLTGTLQGNFVIATSTVIANIGIQTPRVQTNLVDTNYLTIFDVNNNKQQEKIYRGEIYCAPSSTRFIVLQQASKIQNVQITQKGKNLTNCYLFQVFDSSFSIKNDNISEGTTVYWKVISK